MMPAREELAYAEAAFREERLRSIKLAQVLGNLLYALDRMELSHLFSQRVHEALFAAEQELEKLPRPPFPPLRTDRA